MCTLFSWWQLIASETTRATRLSGEFSQTFRTYKKIKSTTINVVVFFFFFLNNEWTVKYGFTLLVSNSR